MRVGTNADQSNDLFMAINGGTVAEIRIYGRALGESEKKTAYMMVRPGSSYVTINNIAANAITAEKIDANAITAGKLATDAIKSINYSAGVDGSFLDLATGEMKMYDDSTGIVRSLEIGPNGGLLAKDANDVIIHDIPNKNIGMTNYYCGHAIWFRNDAAFLLYNSSTQITAWTNIVCEDDGITNARAGIFKIHYGADNSSTLTLTTALYMRPKGTTWGVATSDNTPTLYISYGGNTNLSRAITMRDMMTCPIGDDFSVQVYAVSDLQILTISQVGVMV